jgi:deazaflavin-dependent oxidoreductase (nitroreductase family)
MTAPVTTKPAPRQQRPLLGLRRTPGRLALALFRMPLRAFRHGKGWMLGRTFLMLVHVGRRTGQPHEMVAMVLGDDPVTGELVICSGWGPDVDWLQNLHAGPAREVRICRDRFAPEHRFLSEDEAVAVAAAFRRRHPWRVRLASAILGWGNLFDDAALPDFVRQHPFVGLRPR